MPAATLKKMSQTEAVSVVQQMSEKDDQEDLVAGIPHILSPAIRPTLLIERQHHVIFAALLAIMFLAGWNDASTGPLLPSLRTYYNVDYAIVSLVWVANCCGFFIAGASNVFFADRLGFGYAIIGAGLQAVAYSLMCFGGPFPLFVVAFAINGLGLGLQDAQANTMLSRLPNSSVKMSVAHAVYGLGATVAPLVSTQFVIHVSRFYLYYTISITIAVFATTLLMFVFRGKTEDEICGPRGRDTAESEAEEALKEREPSGRKLARLLKMPIVHLMASYLLLYVGVGIGIGGWITAFLLNERTGGTTAGYVPSGYYGGLTLGRVLLIPCTKLLGNNVSVYAYTFTCIGLEVIVWLVKDFIGNAVAFSLVGFFLGPMYPIIITICAEVVPGSLSTGAIGLIASFGQAGSAIMPFAAGALSDKYGVWSMQPLMISLLGTTVVVWFLIMRVVSGMRKD